MLLKVGDKVSLRVSQSFLKTSDPMPMLRPPDLVSLDELGVVLSLLPLDIVEVKFRRGTFLFNQSHLKHENESEKSEKQ